MDAAEGIQKDAPVANTISALNTSWSNFCKKPIFSQQKLQRELKRLSQNLSGNFSLAKFTIATLTQA